MGPTPKWYLPTTIVALLWNLMGCAAYLADVMMTPADLAKLSEAQQAMYASRPAWSVAATAIAVWAGALGCLGLILRKRWATPVLVVSLLGVIGQDFWFVALSGSMAAAGPVALVLQSVVLIVSIALVFLGRKAAARGWIA